MIRATYGNPPQRTYRISGLGWGRIVTSAEVS